MRAACFVGVSQECWVLSEAPQPGWVLTPPEITKIIFSLLFS